MEIGGRSLGRIARAPFSPGNRRAVLRMPRVYRRTELVDTAGRFLLGRGAWPWTCSVRTPLGVRTFELERSDDLATVNEIFVRLDYEAPDDLRVAVDVGANIGLASLYFLTRNPDAVTYCIEPDPKNLARLKRTLADFDGRFRLSEVAASDTDGEASFFTEETGRYGGLLQHWQPDTITVPTRSFGGLLDEVLAVEPRIDVLKVDTEGTETELVSAIRTDQLDRIDRIYYETEAPTPLHPERYAHRFDCQTNALVHHRLAR